MTRTQQHVRRARSKWTEARHARNAGWPDVAVRLEEEAQRHLTIARWIKRELAVLAKGISLTVED